MSIKFSGANLNINADVNINGLEELISVLKSIDSKLGVGEVPKADTAEPVHASAVTQQVMPSQPPVQPVQAQPVPATTPTQPAVPTAKVAYTFEQIQLCAGKLVQEGKREALLNLIKGFGLNSLTDIQSRPELFNDIAQKLREIGGSI